MSNAHFSWRKIIILGFGQFGISLLWPIFNSLIPPQLERLGLSALVIGFIMTWDNIINMFFQPWVGARSDHVPSRFGRRKPWLMAGAPLAALFFILVPFVRDNFVLIALGIFGTDIGMALFLSPTVSYLGDLFQPRERSKVNGLLNVMVGLGTSIAFLAGGALYKFGVPLPFIFGGGVMSICMLALILTIREPVQPASLDPEAPMGLVPQLRQVSNSTDQRILLLLGADFCWFVSISAVEAFFTLYAKNVLGTDVGTGAQMLAAFSLGFVLFAIPSGLIATLIGRKPTILIGLTGMFAGALAAFTLRSPVLVLIVLAVLGIFWAFVRVNGLPLVYDFGNPRDIGVLTGLFYFSWSAAAIVGPILAGGVIDATNKNYSLLWVFAGLFEALALILMVRVPAKASAEAGAQRRQAPVQP